MAIKSDLAESIADLKSLYNVAATFEYTSRASLMRADRDHTVLITRFLSQMSDIEYGDDNLALPHKGKSLHFRDRKVLIFNMAGATHEILCRALYTLFYEKLKKMNCQGDLIARGRGEKVSLENLNKEPDESWGPKRRRKAFAH
ncbi:hypothetical protein OIDMADRAFT_58143 [Oidiodendron maius Zn]|uniref:Uncharacterized protein n=1 Tax=Oidiodendron maius (strain Zn) TaxID=913774 RepID=A0A0C3H2B1_OIDMZ|nr:hypothetical protein OIDMADRAFT_58143 [Oidiodendron maius Zn]